MAHSREARTAIEGLSRELGLEAIGLREPLPNRLLAVGHGRVGLYKPWVSNIDEGWTRWLLEQHEFRFSTLTNADIQRGELHERLDVIVLPDAGTEQLMNGHTAGRVPAQYVGGLGEDGVAALRAFVHGGGTLVALDSASDFAISALDVPVTNVTAQLSSDEFFCPGSLLAFQLDPTAPLAFGMPEQTAAFFAYGSAFEIDDIASNGAARVVGRYGSGDLLLSGWLEGGEHIAGHPAVVEVDVGAGRVVLVGFRAQHRGQAHATFRLLFNAILTAGAR